jgi:hypothetical protein
MIRRLSILAACLISGCTTAMAQDASALLPWILASSGYSPPRQDQLVGWWRLDGDGVDSSSTTNHGELMGTPLPTNAPGVHSNSLYFAGNAVTSSVVRAAKGGTATALNGATGATCSAWVKFEGATAKYTVFDSYVGAGSVCVRLYFHSGNYPAFMARTIASGGANRSVTSSVAVASATWTHIAGTVNSTSGEMFFYVNGNLTGATTQSFASATFDPSESFSYYDNIGNILHVGGLTWNGWIDEILIWKQPLSQAEVQNLYEQGDPP